MIGAIISHIILSISNNGQLFTLFIQPPGGYRLDSLAWVGALAVAAAFDRIGDAGSTDLFPVLNKTRGLAGRNDTVVQRQ